MEFVFAAGITLILIDIVDNLIKNAFYFKMFFYFCIVIVILDIIMEWDKLK